jgi:hypothetical protein
MAGTTSTVLQTAQRRLGGRLTAAGVLLTSHTVESVPKQNGVES